MISFFNLTYAWYLPIVGIFAFMLIKKKQIYANEHALPGEPYDYDISYNYRVSIAFSIMVFLPLILAAGLREGRFNAIGDTGVYVLQFAKYPNSLSKLTLNGSEKDPGFIVFSVIIKQLFGDNYQIWLFIIATIQGVCLAIGFRRYTSEVVFCAFAFFTSTAYMAWMMNGIRQFLAVTILFAFFPMLSSDKVYKKIIFFIIVFILFFIHSTCIIVVPTYLAVLGKALNKMTILVLVVCILAIVFLGEFTSLLDVALEGTHYSNTSVFLENAHGTNPLRVLFTTLPAIIAIIFRKKIINSCSEYEYLNVAINMSIISASLDLLAMFTSGLMFGRLSVYFNLFNYVLIPWEIKAIVPKENRFFAYFIVVVVYFIFFYIQMQTWGRV